jgi:hypothetical protein
MQAYLIKITLFILFTINQLMAQSFQFNDIQPSTAQKWGRENGRNIFVLIENKFYPNSLKIEKEILLQEEVKSILFNNFICIKLDAESESGSDFIKKFGLSDAVSIVFMGTNDDILIKESRKLSPDEFIELTERARELAKESDPTKLYESEFKNGRKDVSFLEKYLNFLIDKRSVSDENRNKCTEVVEMYFKSIPEEEWTSNKNLAYLIHENYNGHIGSFLYEIVVNLKEKETFYKNLLTRKYVGFVYNSVNVAAKLKDEKLYLRADSIAKTWEKPATQKYEEFFRKCRYYSAVRDTTKLKIYLLDFIAKEVWDYSTNELNSITPQNKDSLRRDMYLHYTRTDNATYYSKVIYEKMNRNLVVDILDEAASTVLIAFKNDKFMLKKGVEWAERTSLLNLFYDDSRRVKFAKLLYLNGDKEKAIKYLEEIIEVSKKYYERQYKSDWIETLEKLKDKMIRNEAI